MTLPPFVPQEVIGRKRDAQTLTRGEIEFMVRGIADGSLGDSQVASFAMAVYLRGMNVDESVALLEAMAHSGRIYDWSSLKLDRPILDKHSTGGVGDKVSLVLAPLVAACGGVVPMISARGLGHTGGTLDKLESVPGYRVFPDDATMRRALVEAGCSIVGATEEIAPADRRLYAVRDVSGTVESVPLITASILSKKLAGGLDALVLDVKTGSGAFMTDLDNARFLARNLVIAANGAKLRCSALITDMNFVLGHSAGNAVEMREAIAYLTTQQRNPRLHEVILSLLTAMIVPAGLAANEADARAKATAALDGGRAAEIFGKMMNIMGGPTNVIEQVDKILPRAPVELPVTAPRDGYVAAMNARSVGLVVHALGGGRRRPEDKIDPRVGLTGVCGPGVKVAAGDPLAIIHARTQADAEQAANRLRSAIVIAPEPPAPTPMVYDRVGDTTNEPRVYPRP